MSKSKSTTRTRLRRRVGIAAGAATIATMSLSAPAFAEPKLTLTASSGPAGGTNSIVATAPSAIFTMDSPKVLFATVGSAGTTLCPANYTNPVAIATTSTGAQSAGIVGVPDENVRKISSTKIAITIPSGPLTDPAIDPDAAWEAYNANGLDLGTNQTVAKYNLCVYATRATSSNPLIASAAYTIADAPTVTDIDYASGPALGGTKITVTGTGFTTGMTASIGGTPLSGITVAAGGTSFTATTAPRTAAADLPLTVTATGGTVTTDPADVTTPIGFSYINGITATPNTNAGNDTVTLDIIGVGFSALDWTPPADSLSAVAHVFLVSGAYDPTDDSSGEADPRTNGPAAECTNVLEISDTEIICDLDVTESINPVSGAVDAATPLDEGAYVVTIVSDGAADADAAPGYYQTRVTSGSIFTVAEY